MSKQKFNIDLVSLDSINVISAMLENDSGFKSINQASLEITFQYQLTPAISIRSKQIQVTAEYEIKAVKSDASTRMITSKYAIVFLFSIENLGELTKLEQEEFSIDEEMLSSLMNITYSTSRGILYTRYLGTVLDGLILPVIATADLYKTAMKSIPTKK